MKISYTNDSGKGPGYGILRCTELALSESGCTFSLQRGTDRCYLNSRQEWLEQQSMLTPAGCRRENGDLLLQIGPGIVNMLDPQESYLMQLRDARGATARSVLRVRDIIRDPSWTPPTDSVPDGPAIPPDDTPPADQATPKDSTPSTAPTAIPPHTPTQADTIAPLTLEGPSPLASRTASAPRRFPLWIPLLLLVPLLGAGIWWYLTTPPPSAPPEQTALQQPDAKTPVSAQTAQQNDATPLAAPAQASAPDSATPTPPAPSATTAEKRVELFFGNPARTPAEAARLSRSLPRATPKEQDNIYRLYYFAGEQGETSVLMDYAACLDPSRPHWGSIGKDPASAWRIYEKASAAGIAEAQAARNSMKQWLQTQAAAGNAQAAYWLRQLPQ